MNRLMIIFILCAFAQGVIVDPLSSRQQATFKQINFLPSEVRSGKIGVGDLALVFLDSGVSSHEDLSGRFNPLLTKNFEDLKGHGTAVTGIAAAITGNAAGIKGISRQADVIPMRVNKVNEDGILYTDKEEVFRAVISLHNLPYRLLVVNMSFALWEGSIAEKKRWEEILFSLKGKALFVVGAGNDPYQNTEDIYPCAASHLPNVICVGGVDSKDSFQSSGSSRGKEVSISAPWCGYTTTASPGGNTYGNACGTSISAPHVSGAATFIAEEILGEKPGEVITPSVLKQALLAGSRFSPALLGQTGIPGILDIQNSLALLRGSALPEVPEVYGFIGWQSGNHEFSRGDFGVIWGKNLENCQVFLNERPLEMIFVPSAQIVFRLPDNIFGFRQSSNVLSLVKSDGKRFLPSTAKVLLKDFTPNK